MRQRGLQQFKLRWDGNDAAKSRQRDRENNRVRGRTKVPCNEGRHLMGACQELLAWGLKINTSWSCVSEVHDRKTLILNAQIVSNELTYDWGNAFTKVAGKVESDTRSSARVNMTTDTIWGEQKMMPVVRAAICRSENVRKVQYDPKWTAITKKKGNSRSLLFSITPAGDNPSLRR